VKFNLNFRENKKYIYLFIFTLNNPKMSLEHALDLPTSILTPREKEKHNRPQSRFAKYITICMLIPALYIGAAMQKNLAEKNKSFHYLFSQDKLECVERFPLKKDGITIGEIRTLKEGNAVAFINSIDKDVYLRKNPSGGYTLIMGHDEIYDKLKERKQKGTSRYTILEHPDGTPNLKAILRGGKIGYYPVLKQEEIKTLSSLIQTAYPYIKE
jgi:hypothetical protein